MSTLALAAGASGTGSVTIQAPATNNTDVINLPDTNGGTIMVSSNQPAFSAYQSTGQSLTGAAYTLGVFQTKEFDTAGCFNNTASTVTLNGLSVPAYSFCPNVPGYYQFNVGCTFASAVIMLLGLYKNTTSGGTMFKRLFYTYTSPVFDGSGSALIYLNGTGDYVSVCNRAETSVSTTAGSDVFWFQGYLVRTA